MISWTLIKFSDLGLSRIVCRKKLIKVITSYSRPTVFYIAAWMYCYLVVVSCKSMHDLRGFNGDDAQDHVTTRDHVINGGSWCSTRPYHACSTLPYGHAGARVPAYAAGASRQRGDHQRSCVCASEYQLKKTNSKSPPRWLFTSLYVTRSISSHLISSHLIWTQQGQFLKTKILTTEAIQRWSAAMSLMTLNFDPSKIPLCASSQGQDLYSYQKLNMYIVHLLVLIWEWLQTPSTTMTTTPTTPDTTVRSLWRHIANVQLSWVEMMTVMWMLL